MEALILETLKVGGVPGLVALLVFYSWFMANRRDSGASKTVVCSLSGPRGDLFQLQLKAMVQEVVRAELDRR